MHKSIALASLAALGLAAGSAFAQVQTCAQKTASIEKEIAHAQQYRHPEKLAGLQKALRETRAHCTQEGQIEKAQEGVRDAQKDVAEARQDLAEAQAKGDTRKIAKRQSRLAEAEAELRQAQAALRQIQSASGLSEQK